jgi:hypothetical protein
MNPKPISNAVKKGFSYLVSQQHADGGWGQGGGWRSDTQGGRVEGANVQDPADVANTCVAVLALLRGGHTPCKGDYANQIVRGLDFVLLNVERAEANSPYVTELRDTQVQTKIGPYVDTFVASLALAEAKGQMPDEAGEVRLSSALEKVIGKMERHQQTDGTWAMGGWAPVVGQGLASAGLNRARARGARVSDEALEKTERYARAQYDVGSKTFSGAGSAQVPLYATASHLSAASKTIHNFKAAKSRLREVVDSATASAAEQSAAAERLKYIDEAESAHEESLSASYAYFQDQGFVQGFGSNGGEEFLSYLNISETLVQKGGKEWDDWDRSMTENLERIQNKDGSWTGHHCITGRTFCTAAALLVLLADRVPHTVPRPEPVSV